MIRLRYISTLSALLFAFAFYAQTNIDLAYKNFKEKNYKVAQDYIDKVITQDGINKDPQVWQLRALIYKKLVKEAGISARDTALASLDKADQLDADGKYKDKIQGYRKNIVIEYYNDAVVNLKSGRCEDSEKSYKLYKKLYEALIDKDRNFIEQDVEYYLALSSKYENLSKAQTDEAKAKEIMDKALATLRIVLDLDSTNFDANLRYGIIHYNRGVNMILGLTPKASLEECVRTNKESVDLFNIALPYFLRAYETNPNKRDIVEGLAGIYTNLMNKEKAKEFVEKLKEFDE